MHVIVDGLLVNYVRSGSGKTVILIHGWGSTLNDLSGLFKELTNDFDVISIDLPGFGASQSPKSTWGLAEYASFLNKFRKKLDVKRVYSLIGHSNGGAIAIKAVSSGDILADNLVLISSSGIRTSQQGRLGAVKLGTKIAKTASLPLPSKTRKKLRSKLYQSIGSDYLVAEHLSASFKKIVSEDLQVDAKNLSLPTLLIYGEEDKETPVRYGELYHQLIDGSTLEIVAGSGHFVQKDKPKLVVKLIRDFLC